MLSGRSVFLFRQASRFAPKAFRVQFPLLPVRSSHDFSYPCGRTPNHLISNVPKQKTTLKGVQGALKQATDYVPQPTVGIKFKPETVGPLSMMVAEDIPGVGPFFLDQEQYNFLKDWICIRPQGHLLVVSGTIKCGKSVLLQKVIPAMVLDNPHPDKHPVFVYVPIESGSSPQDVANFLLSCVEKAALNHGIKFTRSFPRNPINDASLDLPEIVQSFSDKGFELWILLDEVQEPYVWCISESSPTLADRFSGFLKGIFTKCCEAGGRVVMTGSGMMTLLSKIKRMKPNGIYVWAVTAILSRGHAYDCGVFEEMARRMLKHFKPSLNPLLRNFVTEKHILDTFKKDSGIVGMRPALLAHFLHILQGDRVVNAQESFERAWEEVLKKLSMEANIQTAAGLKSLDDEERIKLRAFARGELTAKELSRFDGESAAELSRSEKDLFDIIQSLLELPDPSGKRQTFQPPYGDLCERWILRDGKLCVAIRGNKLVYLPYSNLKLISDREKSMGSEAQRAIHNAVVEVVLPSGPANPQTHEIRAADCVKKITSKLGSDSRKHPDNVEFINMLSSQTTPSDLWGFEFLILVHHFLFHVHDQDFIKDLGPDFLMDITKAASAALVEAKPKGFRLDQDGLLVEKKEVGTQAPSKHSSSRVVPSVGGPPLSSTVPRAQEECKIYVGNLPDDVGAAFLIETFKGFGRVTSAYIIPNKATNLSEHFGFVIFDNPDSARNAILASGMNESPIGHLKVRLAEERRNKKSHR